MSLYAVNVKMFQVFFRFAPLAATGLVLIQPPPACGQGGAPGPQAFLDRPQLVAASVTNWTPRFVTNLIEVRMPQNLYVDEYRTNWFTQRVTNINWFTLYATNVFEVFQTNRIVRTQTNEVVFERITTNQVLVYHTNFIPAYQTNFISAYQTNFTPAYQTNLKTLTLTNWETVLVMKTNWVKQLVTNVVEIEMPVPVAAAPIAAAASPPAQRETKPEAIPATVTPAAALPGLTFELMNTAGTSRNNQVEVQMSLRADGNPAAPLPVEEWRVERVDRAVLVFGQRPEFKGLLPPGTYKITAKVRPDEKGPLLTARSQTEISLTGVSQKIPASVTAPR
ncbi:MAG: hypothetical protein FJ387_19180 [Verrucomicrobia bacterium]|nr:hypothetical protein [Verrucomicrobiota bacterium]